MVKEWDNRWIGLAKTISTWSKDPSKQIGAVAVSADNQLLDVGYNGFPRGADDSEELYKDSAYKANHVIHAEMNCNYNAASKGIKLCGCTMYIYGLRPCSKCMLAMWAIKVNRVVVVNAYPDDPKWNEDWKISHGILVKSNIIYRELPK